VLRAVEVAELHGLLLPWKAACRGQAEGAGAEGAGAPGSDATEAFKGHEADQNSATRGRVWLTFVQSFSIAVTSFPKV